MCFQSVTVHPQDLQLSGPNSRNPAQEDLNRTVLGSLMECESLGLNWALVVASESAAHGAENGVSGGAGVRLQRSSGCERVSLLSVALCLITPS